MKKLIAILLISAIGGDSIRIGELMKLPNLVLHFSEHKSTHPGDTGMAFLIKHYIEDQQPESENDKNSDAKLPYKSSLNIQSHITSIVFSDNTIHFIIDPIEKSFLKYQESTTSSCFIDIWLPPKMG